MFDLALAAARRSTRRRWIRPLALRGSGLILEGAAVWGIGVMANSVVHATRAQLPTPLFAACGYMSLLLLQQGLVDPPHGAKTGLAMRSLASIFTCLAMLAGPAIF